MFQESTFDYIDMICLSFGGTGDRHRYTGWVKQDSLMAGDQFDKFVSSSFTITF